MKILNREKGAGFTLIEIMIVIVVIGIIAAIVITQLSPATRRADIATGQAFSAKIGIELADALVSEWRFDECEGTTVYDAWGTNHGTIEGTGWEWVSSQISRCALSFSGSAYVNAPNVNLPSSWTIAAWSYAKNVADGAWNTLTRGNAGDHQIILKSDTGELGMYDNVGGTAFRGTGYDGVQLENSWHHITVVGDAGVQDFYIDGVYVGSSDTQSTTDVRSIGNYFGGGQSWGIVDDVRIYAAALSSAAIQKHYVQGLQKLLANNAITEEEYSQRISQLNHQIANR